MLQHLCQKGSGEVVKRWVNEAQEAVSSDNVMVQYHAMGVLYHIRKRDKYVGLLPPPCGTNEVNGFVLISAHHLMQAGCVQNGDQADQVLAEVPPRLLPPGELVPDGQSVYSRTYVF